MYVYVVMWDYGILWPVWIYMGALYSKQHLLSLLHFGDVDSGALGDWHLRSQTPDMRAISRDTRI